MYVSYVLKHAPLRRKAVRITMLLQHDYIVKATKLRRKGTPLYDVKGTRLQRKDNAIWP